MAIEPIIAKSARRHGVSDEDMLHAYAHPIRIFELDDGCAIIFEVGVVDGESAPVIVHAMRAREKFLR